MPVNLASPALTNGASPRPPRRLWQVPIFLLGLVSLLIVAACPTAREHRFVQGIERDLATIRHDLQARDADPAAILPLALDVMSRTSQAPAFEAEAHLALGAVYLRQADKAPADQAINLRRKALSQLELAEA